MLTAGHYIILTDRAEPVFPYREILLHVLQSPRDFLLQRSILLSEAAKHIMLRAARMVNVPERLSGKSFNFSKIARLFHADCKI